MAFTLGNGSLVTQLVHDVWPGSKQANNPIWYIQVRTKSRWHNYQLLDYDNAFLAGERQGFVLRRSNFDGIHVSVVQVGDRKIRLYTAS